MLRTDRRPTRSSTCPNQGDLGARSGGDTRDGYGEKKGSKWLWQRNEGNFVIFLMLCLL